MKSGGFLDSTRGYECLKKDSAHGISYMQPVTHLIRPYAISFRGYKICYNSM